MSHIGVHLHALVAALAAIMLSACLPPPAADERSLTQPPTDSLGEVDYMGIANVSTWRVVNGRAEFSRNKRPDFHNRPLSQSTALQKSRNIINGVNRILARDPNFPHASNRPRYSGGYTVGIVRLMPYLAGSDSTELLRPVYPTMPARQRNVPTGKNPRTAPGPLNPNAYQPLPPPVEVQVQLIKGYYYGFENQDGRIVASGWIAGDVSAEYIARVLTDIANLR